MPYALMLAMQAAHVAQSPPTHGETSWLMIFAGLIPILGIAAAGYLVYRLARDDGEAEAPQE
jgi:hypothetical protein